MALSFFSQEVLNKADIVKVIGSFLPLKKKGRDYVAVCPFHADTNPSLSVSPSRNIYKCFVCGNAGSSVTFVMRYLNITWGQALVKVAEICGIPVPENQKRFTVAKEIPKPQKALDDLEEFYRFSLKSQQGKAAAEYLKRRQISPEVADKFGIGYAPMDNSLAIKALKERKGYSLTDLTEAGIISEGSTSFHDRYSSRIMFPIRDAYGHTVGFSGRKFLPDDSSDSKYINSPETKFFVKSKILYNFDNARSVAKKTGYLYVVEGFMDCIALARAGIDSAVALMGTALTKEHIQLLKSLNVEIRMCLDSDKAGQENTRKWIPLLTKAGLNVRIVKPFPAEEGKDADEIIDREGDKVLVEKLNLLLDPITYNLETLSPTSPDLLSNVDSIIENGREAFSQFSPLEKEKLIDRISKLTGLSANLIRGRFAGSADSDEKALFDTDIRETLGNESLSEIAAKLSRYIQGKLKKSLSGFNIEPRIYFNESSIIVRLPLSADACEMFSNRIMEDGGLVIGVFKTIADYILDMLGEGEMGANGLTSDQILSIQAKIEDAKEEGLADEVSGFDSVELSSILSFLIAGQGHRFISSDMADLLNQHKNLLAKQRMYRLRNDTSSDKKSNSEYQELVKENTK